MWSLSSALGITHIKVFCCYNIPWLPFSFAFYCLQDHRLSVFWWSKNKEKNHWSQIGAEFRVQEFCSWNSGTCLCRHISHVNHYAMSSRNAYEVFSVSFWLVALPASLGDMAVKNEGSCLQNYFKCWFWQVADTCSGPLLIYFALKNIL